MDGGRASSTTSALDRHAWHALFVVLLVRSPPSPLGAMRRRAWSDDPLRCPQVWGRSSATAGDTSFHRLIISSSHRLVIAFTHQLSSHRRVSSSSHTSSQRLVTSHRLLCGRLNATSARRRDMSPCCLVVSSPRRHIVTYPHCHSAWSYHHHIVPSSHCLIVESHSIVLFDRQRVARRR